MFYFFYNSLPGKYMLRVRLVALLFFFSTVSGACSTGTTEHGDIPVEDEMRNSRPDTAAAKRKALAPANRTIDLLGNPFLADYRQSRSLNAYFARINADFTLEAEPIENTHRASVTDTIYIIRFGDSMIELYAPTQTGDLLLQVADIHSNGIVLRNNMKVGMSQPELMNKLKNFDVRIMQTNSEVVATSMEGAPASLRFYLKNGKVKRIRYEGYVD
ncbi:hypothetical protein [Botryobacter ruber]|uniref:hypothetical protein n=1 Tax=Botryobacter ruber TaxID=2171629 RepID=UPI000E0C5EAD|nr:hypothetical protein [Botryobacter ruber]